MGFGAQPRQPLLALSICAMTGIAAAEYVPVNVTGAMVVVAFLAVAAWRWQRAAHVFVFGAFFLLHALNPRGESGRELASMLGSGPTTMRIIGVITDEPREQEDAHGKPRFTFPLKIETASLRETETRASAATVLVRWPGPEPEYGDRLELTGDATNIEPPRNPGEYEFSRAMQRRGVFSEVRMRSAGEGRVLEKNRGSAIYRFAIHTRQWMERTLSRDLDDVPEMASLIRGMVLGSRADTPPEMEDLFRQTGTMHLFAVSGLNVAMFAYIAWGLLKLCGVRRGAATPLLIALVVFYAVLTGLSASGVRAAIMTGLLLGGFLLDRPALALNSLGAAICVILLWDTNQLFATGFQLSFAVVLAIFLFAKPIRNGVEKVLVPDEFLPRRLYGKKQHAQRWCGSMAAESVGVSVAAWLGSLLLNLHYFHLLSPWTVMANLVVVPLAFVVMVAGALSLLSAAFSLWTVAIFNNANLAITYGVIGTVKFFASLPGSGVYVAWPERARPEVCALTVLDMGNGAAIHLHGSSVDWMIDCGSERQYRWKVRSYLRWSGINDLGGLILSHGDIEHIGAAPSLLHDFQVDTIMDSVVRDRSSSRHTLQTQLVAARRGRCLVLPGDVIPLASNMELRVLYPTGETTARVADDKALVVQLRAGKTRVLFISDSGFFTEHFLLENHADLRSDILVKGRHMSDISGTAEFLRAVGPKVIVCSGADFPRQARVPADWAREVAANGINLFQQDQTGAVRIGIEREGFSVKAFRGDQSFRSLSR